MKKAVAYLRVSGQGQVGGTGFDRQRELCGRYAEKYNFHIVENYREEGISGASDETERPAFQKMLEELLSNSIRIVIVEGLDRLARTLQVQETLLIYLASKGIELHSARTEDNVTASMQEDPMKKALIQIQGVFSELEKNLLVLKLRKARDKIRAEKGRCEGVAPYGEEDPQEAVVVQRVLNYRRLGWNYSSIARQLNEDEIPTRHGREWSATQIKRICSRRGQP